MPEGPGSGPVVYQLRVVLRGISPLIWRRILVRSDSTIADLHATLQLACGWRDEHPHRFVVNGREYGISYAGGLTFRDAHDIRLADLGFEPGERFVYEYDFTDRWELLPSASRSLLRAASFSPLLASVQTLPAGRGAEAGRGQR
jgi:hypothetical protein